MTSGYSGSVQTSAPRLCPSTPHRYSPSRGARCGLALKKRKSCFRSLQRSWNVSSSRWSSGLSVRSMCRAGSVLLSLNHDRVTGHHRIGMISCPRTANSRARRLLAAWRKWVRTRRRAHGARPLTILARQFRNPLLDVVPADVRLLRADAIACDESVLTGESPAAEKRVAPCPAAPGAQRLGQAAGRNRGRVQAGPAH